MNWNKIEEWLWRAVTVALLIGVAILMGDLL